MGYTIDVIRRARRRLEERNADLRSRQNARLEEAYRRLPRLKELDMALRRTMIAAAQAALSGGDAESAMEAVRRENQALQAERDALVREKLPEGFLEDSICPRCDGTGYIGTQMCQCLDALCRQEQEKEISRLGKPNQCFDAFRLDVYPDTVDGRTGAVPREVARRALQVCRDFSRDFGKGKGNLLLNGMPGLGKTFLAVSVGKEVTAQGKTVCYETASSLFDKLERARFNPSEESQRQAWEITGCDLLIVDDLGTEFAGQFVNAALYSLINSRLLAEKPMLITSNLTVREMEKRYTPQIASRLSGEFTQLFLLGEDLRRAK